MKTLMLNRTDDYYSGAGDSLGWELTVCNALYPKNSPCRGVLERDDTFGNLLYDYLGRFIPMRRITRIIEIGGGYGYLMRDFLEKDPRLKVTMLDIAPHLSERQQMSLKNWSVDYILEDFTMTEVSCLEGMDMAILNENLGDFPTALDIPAEIFEVDADNLEGTLKKVLHLFEKYDFDQPETRAFNMNIGAIEAVEKLCIAGIPYIFLSEHSCEASIPEDLQDLIRIESTGCPEKISLKGHDEYTIKFSYLEKIAKIFHYRTVRGSFADFLEPRFDHRLRHMLALRSVREEFIEIIHQFLEDLYKYEYLILIKEDGDSLDVQ